MHACGRRSGFSLVELLVSVGVTSLLVGLLVPTLQAARESARATVCRNHVAQLAKAMLHHDAAQRQFPSGGWGDLWLGVAERGAGAPQPGGWAYGILPYLEQQSLFQSVAGVSAANAGAVYAGLLTAPMPVYSCPSRRASRPLPLAGATYRTGGDGATTPPAATRSDYAACAGMSASCPPISIYLAYYTDPALSAKKVKMCHATNGAAGGNTQEIGLKAMFDNGHAGHTDDHVGPCTGCSNPVVVESPTSLADGDAWVRGSIIDRIVRADDGLPDLQDGIVFRMSAVTAAAVRDGLTNTYLVGEKAVDAARYETGTDAGDDAPLHVGYADDTLRWGYDPPDRDGVGVSRPQAFGSAHREAFAMAFADGSVRPVEYGIDPAVHKALAGRKDGTVVSPP